MWQRKGRILPITLRQALSNPKKPRWIHQKREKKWGGGGRGEETQSILVEVQNSAIFNV